MRYVRGFKKKKPQKKKKKKSFTHQNLCRDSREDLLPKNHIRKSLSNTNRKHLNIALENLYSYAKILFT